MQYICSMENDSRFILDGRLRDLVVCLSGTDMTDEEIISVCLALYGHPAVCSHLTIYLECGERSSAEVLSFLVLTTETKREPARSF